MADAWGGSWGTSWASYWQAGTAPATPEGGYIRPRRRRDYIRLPEDRDERLPERKPRIRAVPQPLDNNADEVIARATTDIDSVLPPVLAGIDSGIDQRRKDDEALLLIMLLAE